MTAGNRRGRLPYRLGVDARNIACTGVGRLTDITVQAGNILKDGLRWNWLQTTRHTVQTHLE